MSHTNPSNANAAAMDTLNLDDLFNDDPNDSFLEDMGIDLGDISGVFNEGGGDVMNQEFGRGGSVGSSRPLSVVGSQIQMRQTQGKKRGSKVALTHAQIMMNLGTKKDTEKPKTAGNDEGTITQRIRTRRETRSSETYGAASKNVRSIASKHDAVNKEKKVEVSREIQAAIEAVADYGIQPSMEFYPYMPLPHEIEVKRGQKAFPCLDKVNHATSAADKNKGSTISNDPNINVTPLQLLCASHPGSNHGLVVEVNNSLNASTHLAKSFLNPSHSMFSSLKEDLSKLLLNVMKQSAFLRQNIWNMESHAKKNLLDSEFKSIFVTSRKEIEDLLTLISRDGVQAVLAPAIAKTECTSPEKTGSSGKLNIKPMVSVRVKPRVQGWRDKSGRKLVARFKPPKKWKIATKRAKNLAIKKKQEEEAVNAIHSVNPLVLKATAAEILQSSLLVQKETLKPKPLNKKKVESPTATKKASCRKRKSTTLPCVTKTSTVASTTAAPELTPTTPFFDKFYIPSYKPPYSADITYAVVSSTDITNSNEHFLSRAQQLHLLRVLHTKILHPSLSPTDRRTILANEISSTIKKLETARLNKEMAKARGIQKEINVLEFIYKKDLERMPEVANTTGFWHWIEETKYFNLIQKSDVHDATDFFLGAFSGKDDGDVGGGKFCGSSLPPVVVQTEAEDKSTVDTEKSPLFDCMQSLLVEVNDDDEHYDDDELFADLPSFSMHQLLHGPDSTDTDSDEDDVLDVSRLSLDQRVYLQLRAAGLIDTLALPSNTSHKIEENASPILCTSLIGTSDLDDVIKRMKLDLSKLDFTNKSAVSELQRLALSHVSNTSKQKKQMREYETVINKYNDMKREQIEKRRVSDRFKVEPTKFNGEK